MIHELMCPCSEFPSGRYCYLIDPNTGICIECECNPTNQWRTMKYEQLEFDFDYAEEQWRKLNESA